MVEMIARPIQKHLGILTMDSGSQRDGFRFKSSDIDIMFWSTTNKVICDISNLNVSNPCTILMEDSDAPPGFVKLKLLTPIRNLKLLDSLEDQMIDNYISSEKFSHSVYCSLTKSRILTEKLRPHGPCSSFYSAGYENDFGVCMACQQWPRTAQTWIARCHLKQWPSQVVISEIISNGCHVMPIGSNSTTNERELEWRVSFSHAERTIVYSFNHTQFLSYGILKIFSKELLSAATNDTLICSYFLKTVLFWEIQNYPESTFWCLSNLLNCFWVCFKRLCKCVFDSNCPNFFIPENNMFKCKIIGASREALLSKLIGYYEKGFACLQLSQTLSSILTPALSSPSIVIPFTKGHDLSLVEMDKCISKELFQCHVPMQNGKECYVTLKSIVNLLKLSLSQFQSLALQHALSDILTQTAFILAQHFELNKNKVK